jgi:NADPH:quinone reductase-like Zn-dependent oxidoreductase
METQEYVQSTRPETLPGTMRAVVWQEDGTLAVIKKTMPKPGPGQVLVKMAYAPINPSDLGFDEYDLDKPHPLVPGLEGSGTVVAAGPGFIAQWLVNRRVACGSLHNGDGTWAEYMVTAANRCVPLGANVSHEQAATLIVNPWSALALLELAQKGHHRAMVITPGASQVGRMLLQLGKRHRITPVLIVRRTEQVELLRSLGAEYVLSTSEPDFDAQLTKLCIELDATIAFDAVAGEMTHRLLHALPQGGRVVVYAHLSNQPGQVTFEDLCLGDKSVQGFWLTHWIARKNYVQMLWLAWQTQKLVGSDLKTEIRAKIPLDQIDQAMKLYRSNRTAGKILLALGGT